LASAPHILKLFSRAALVGAMFITFALKTARAAELIMFERAGCEWCEAFDKQIAPVYAKTEEGLRAPLRRVDIEQGLPADLAFIRLERLTPLFILIEKGREIGRIRGYPGPESFWMQLTTLFEKLGVSGTGGERAQLLQKQLRQFD
jgi:thioredoxin-related protein